MPYKDPAKRRAHDKLWRTTDRAKNYKREWSERNANRLKERRWRQQGIVITVAERNALLTKQKGRCAVCDRHESEFSKALAVDHDHRTGAVRGLLCGVCNNKVVAVAEKYRNLIPKALRYLNDERNLAAATSRALDIPGLKRNQEADRGMGPSSGRAT